MRRAAASSSSTGAVTRLSSVVVVPWPRWNSTPSTTSSGSPVVKLCPPPPWTWRSTNPGNDRPRPLPAAPAGTSPPPTLGDAVAGGLDPAAHDARRRDDAPGDRRSRRRPRRTRVPRRRGDRRGELGDVASGGEPPRLEGGADEAGVGGESGRDDPWQLPPRQLAPPSPPRAGRSASRRRGRARRR